MPHAANAGGSAHDAEPHPLETPYGIRLLEMLREAGSAEDWHQAASAIVVMLCAHAEPKRTPSPGEALRWREGRWELGTVIRRGWQPRQGAPRAVGQEIADGWWLSCSLTFAEAAAALARTEGIALAAARKRLERMERRHGQKLPRLAKAFRRSRTKRGD